LDVSSKEQTDANETGKKAECGRPNGCWGVHEAYLISVEHAPFPAMLQLRKHEAIGVRIIRDNNLGAAFLGGLKCEL
jgi:hypothetical protein